MRPRQPRAAPGGGTERRSPRTHPEAKPARFDVESEGSIGTAGRRGMDAVVAAMTAGTPEEVTGHDETARRAGHGRARKPL
jgi:hypothetical protein